MFVRRRASRPERDCTGSRKLVLPFVFVASMLVYVSCDDAATRKPRSDDDGNTGAGGGPSSQACSDYISCVAATQPGAVGDAIAVYGSEGSCWKELQDVECLTACEIGLSDLGSTYPEVDACKTGDDVDPFPVNFYILVDKSGSMSADNKWTNTETSFVWFFQHATSQDLKVALRFWPDEGCEEPSCDAAACATPQVALGPLSDPAHQQALIDAFASKRPGGFTPMSAALEGGVAWARLQMMNEPDRASVVIFVTDGEPGGCIEDPIAIAEIAAKGFDNDGIRIYAVGLEGSGESLLASIATAGGTGKAFFIGAANGDDELLAALLQIADDAGKGP